MEIEMLHAFRGDKRKIIDTSTPEARLDAKKLIESLLEQGISLFLETLKGAYLIRGYDADEDKFIIAMPTEGRITVGDKPASKPMKIAVKGKRHMTAVAPVAGGKP